MFTYDKDDLEQAIIDVFDSKTDFDNIFSFICEAPEEELNIDNVSNIMMGACEFLNMRLNRLYRVYDEMESNGRVK